jgi:hypothetical protein
VTNNDLGITEQLQELIEKRDVSVELGGATVTVSPRNLEENELGLTLKLPSSAEPRSEYPLCNVYYVLGGGWGNALLPWTMWSVSHLTGYNGKNVNALKTILHRVKRFD